MPLRRFPSGDSPPSRFSSTFSLDNSFLAVASLGLTFVILSGGIDLSVGGVVGLASVVLATLLEENT